MNELKSTTLWVIYEGKIVIIRDEPVAMRVLSFTEDLDLKLPANAKTLEQISDSLIFQGAKEISVTNREGKELLIRAIMSTMQKPHMASTTLDTK